MSKFVTPQTVGAQALTVSSKEALHLTGATQVVGQDAYVYVKAGSALAAAAVVALSTVGTELVTSAGTGYTVVSAVPIGEYFWVKKTAALI